MDISSIELQYVSNGFAFKTDHFKTIEEGMKEFDRLKSSPVDLFPLLVVNVNNNNWNYEILSRENVMYVAKEGNGCHTGWFGNVSHLLKIHNKK